MCFTSIVYICQCLLWLCASFWPFVVAFVKLHKRPIHKMLVRTKRQYPRIPFRTIYKYTYRKRIYNLYFQSNIRRQHQRHVTIHKMCQFAFEDTDNLKRLGNLENFLCFWVKCKLFTQWGQYAKQKHEHSPLTILIEIKRM